MKKYPELSDILPVGIYRIKVQSQDKWDKEQGKFIKGEQKQGVASNGKPYFFYNTPDFLFKSPDGQKDYRYSIMAFGVEQKAILDNGEVEAVVKELDKWATDETGQPMIVDGKGVREKRVYFNEIKSSTPEKISTMLDFTKKEEEQETVTVEDLEGLF